MPDSPSRQSKREGLLDQSGVRMRERVLGRQLALGPAGHLIGRGEGIEFGEKAIPQLR
jgi:hypothetical protein